MKVKSEKTKLIIWALIALVIGVVIGMIITNATTGNATKFNPNSLLTQPILLEQVNINNKESYPIQSKGMFICGCMNAAGDVSYHLDYTPGDNFWTRCYEICGSEHPFSLWYEAY